MNYIQLRLPHPDGIRRTYNELYKQYWPGLTFHANRLIDNKPEAEDIASRSILKLFRSDQQFDSDENVKDISPYD